MIRSQSRAADHAFARTPRDLWRDIATSRWCKRAPASAFAAPASQYASRTAGAIRVAPPRARR
jgi:hypothetical protein